MAPLNQSHFASPPDSPRRAIDWVRDVWKVWTITKKSCAQLRFYTLNQWKFKLTMIAKTLKKSCTPIILYIDVSYTGCPKLNENQPLMIDSWDHLETKILIPKCWGRLHKNVQTIDYCRMENTITLTAESYFLFYIYPSIDIDIIAWYAGSLMRYALSIGGRNALIGNF